MVSVVNNLLLVVFRSQLVLGVHHTGEGEAVAGRTEKQKKVRVQNK